MGAVDVADTKLTNSIDSSAQPASFLSEQLDTKEGMISSHNKRLKFVNQATNEEARPLSWFREAIIASSFCKY
jgi:hypothetical protein